MILKQKTKKHKRFVRVFVQNNCLSGYLSYKTKILG